MEIKSLAKLKYKGITKRWIKNILLIILIVLLVLEIASAFIIKQYFYKQTESIMRSEIEKSRVEILKSGASNSEEFMVSARLFTETYDKKEKMEASALNLKGVQIASSSGITYNSDIKRTSDIENIIDGDNDICIYEGANSSGEKIMSVSAPYIDDSGKNLGIISFMVSLEPINRQIHVIIFIVFLVCVVLFLFVAFTGNYFIRSIIMPLGRVSQASRKIALGDFTVRINSPTEDDEIAELCESINYMAKELGQTEKIKNDFISSVSHELRTPLTAIQGWAETVKNSNTKEITEKGMDIIVREATRLSGLLEELLDFSHLETGELKINFDRVDILAELSEAVYIYERQAKDAGLSLIYKEMDEVVYVVGDSNRLRQVFINIIDNAVKYSQRGGTVSVEATVSENDVAISVKDNGVGIPANEIENVKEKFYKVNHTIKGSGIGLAVADEIISRHNGSLNIESVENEGTTVIITLPVNKSEEVTEKDLIQKIESEDNNE